MKRAERQIIWRITERLPRKSARRYGGTDSTQFVSLLDFHRHALLYLGMYKIKKYTYLSLDKRHRIDYQFTFLEDVFLRHNTFHLHLTGTFFPTKINGCSQHINGLFLFYCICNLENIKKCFKLIRSIKAVQYSFVQQQKHSTSELFHMMATSYTWLPTPEIQLAQLSLQLYSVLIK